ncbi:MAG TPA: hypothetical protein VJV05_00985 [Pyrinomonadaceae bacterium]|nr:hypothetical protein [Pyrinomonadaceae bacterium]
MPESEAIVDGEGGKRVTITIAEVNELLEQPPISPGDDPNTFVIYNGKYKLTITIAE